MKLNIPILTSLSAPRCHLFSVSKEQNGEEECGGSLECKYAPLSAADVGVKSHCCDVVGGRWHLGNDPPALCQLSSHFSARHEILFQLCGDSEVPRPILRQTITDGRGELSEEPHVPSVSVLFKVLSF